MKNSILHTKRRGIFVDDSIPSIFSRSFSSSNKITQKIPQEIKFSPNLLELVNLTNVNNIFSQMSPFYSIYEKFVADYRDDFDDEMCFESIQPLRPQRRHSRFQIENLSINGSKSGDRWTLAVVTLVFSDEQMKLRREIANDLRNLRGSRDFEAHN